MDAQSHHFAKGCFLLMLLPHSRPQYSFTKLRFPLSPKEPNKKKRKKRNGEAAEDRLFWYTKLSSAQHRDRGKALEYLRAKGGLSPRSQLACWYLNSLESPLTHGLQIPQLHNLCHRCELHQRGTQCSIFPPPSSPERGEERGPHLPVSVIISSWFARLGMLTSLKNKAKMALYCQSECFYVCLPGAVRNWKGFKSFKIPTIPSSQNI